MRGKVDLGRVLGSYVGVLRGLTKATVAVEIVLVACAGFLFAQEVVHSPMGGPDPHAITRLVGAFSVCMLVGLSDLLRRLLTVVRDLALELRTHLPTLMAAAEDKKAAATSS